ncbi:MAG: helix-turn-helix transcriptional regulator [Lachnospiraceae bacterium]|nr:helix-turn-helix transcriptional regulator [Lachnospiraceae bacterium]
MNTDVSAYAGRGDGDKRNVSCESVADFIGPRIKELCEKKHIKKYRLARQSDVSVSNITRYIAGRRVPDITTLEKLCMGLEISLSEFFEDVPRMADSESNETEDAILEVWESLDQSGRGNLLSYGRYLADAAGK